MRIADVVFAKDPLKAPWGPHFGNNWFGQKLTHLSSLRLLQTFLPIHAGVGSGLKRDPLKINWNLSK